MRQLRLGKNVRANQKSGSGAFVWNNGAKGNLVQSLGKHIYLKYKTQIKIGKANLNVDQSVLAIALQIHLM